MKAPSAICLKFTGEVPDPVRARISYAFRVFAAIHGYPVVDGNGAQAEFCFVYGGVAPQERSSHSFSVPARYRLRPAEAPPPTPVKHRYANQDHYLFYGIDEARGNPDWLGEIFEWISSSTEMHIRGRDSAGRIPYSGMIFEQYQIPPRKPYATLLMAWMENSFRNGNAGQALPKAPSPIPGAEHIVVCSHDIDFYHVSELSTLKRLIKNLAISCLLYRSWSYFSSSAKLIGEALTGRRVGDYLPAMLDAIENCQFQSTLFVVPRGGHRRDPNYNLDDLLPRLDAAMKKGFPVGLHGSYGSIVNDGTLVRETQILEKAVGKKPLGSRQHWLRFDRHQKLFEAIEEAGLLFDSTLGFSEAVGFRNGASFAFPPYDFRNEKAHEFLEIPLVLMDVCLEETSRALNENPQELADEILRESRKWAWGGISVLWHNPMEPLPVTEEVNRVFWDCAKRQSQNAEKWMSAEQFLAHSFSRYQNAGLLRGVRLDA
ncbi:MAG TPA: hypothetical protein VJX72_00545 [Candidatus Acidoferrum sp.]|nr:hypothetical protein [Candidatus Acidoferrum sp.]